jgi:N-terminal acetyltransferase 2
MLRTTISGARGAFRAPLRLSFQRSNPTTSFRPLTRRTITSSAPSRASKPSTSFTFTSHARPSPLRNPTLLQRIRSLRFFHNTRPRRNGKPSPDPAPKPSAAEPEPQSLGARMRKLSREYGWSALGVYFALTALDFPFCYMFVRYMGTDRIGELVFPCRIEGRSVKSRVE